VLIRNLIDDTRGRVRISVVGLSAVFVLALVAGFLFGGPQGEVPVAYAYPCQVANGPCSYGDITKTAALEVLHMGDDGGGGYTLPVEPDTGESWNITAYWNNATPICYESTETASVDVDWNGSSWVLSSEGTTTNIIDIDICSTSATCRGTGGAHSWGYKLIVDITDPHTATGRNLRQVVFTTTSVDDGNEITFTGGGLTTCNSLGSSVSPTSEEFTALDWPEEWPMSRCAFSCSVVGTSVDLTYE